MGERKRHGAAFFASNRVMGHSEATGAQNTETVLGSARQNACSL